LTFLTASKASSKLPSISTISAPYIMACANLPKATFPFGITITALSPAFAAYAAADADVFPVEAQITILLPSSAALATAITMPRSLKEPVGFTIGSCHQFRQFPRHTSWPALIYLKQLFLLE